MVMICLWNMIKGAVVGENIRKNHNVYGSDRDSSGLPMQASILHVLMNALLVSRVQAGPAQSNLIKPNQTSF